MWRFSPAAEPLVVFGDQFLSMSFGLLIPSAAALIAVRTDAAMHIVVGSGGVPIIRDRGEVRDMLEEVETTGLDSRK
jgi:hypothetical protein